MTRHAALAGLAVTALLWAPAQAQGQVDPLTCLQALQNKSAPSFLQTCGPQLLGMLGIGGDLSGDALRADLEAALDRLKQPETLNLALGKVEGGTPLKRILEPLNLEFVNLQSDDRTALGLRYDWTKDLRHARQGEGVNHWGYQVNAKASGTVTAEASQNTENFLQSGGEVSFFVSRGGVLEGDDLADMLNELEDEMAGFDDFGSLRASDAYGRFMGAVWDRLSTQTYLRFDGSFSYEADQRFDRTQSAYGARLGVDVKGWSPSGPLADLNLFDWPAALLRLFTGYDESFRPLGSTIPTLVVGLDQVDPSANPEREALGEMDAFTRVSFELAYRSPVARLAQGPVFLEMGFRAYEELGASNAIRGADLDGTRRFFAALTGPAGITASYASGRLPFDLQSTEVWGLGFRYTF